MGEFYKVVVRLVFLAADFLHRNLIPKSYSSTGDVLDLGL